ncbi:DUF4124 domain-containing protein [Microbulbifer sp. OS29]|uniref:DUF4124 domain-containing protein n=1 Tax=Microbulbifer okhotskensis TaxID=2926617 RepID=A0A9X2EIA0_9GAMM|nr:DUF4124 domain-containing protein [Microbulbifer okhotskensis]MCO1332737.1 DUF4124 domain-containing protein [Microbulbifer okhotskensis]
MKLLCLEVVLGGLLLTASAVAYSGELYRWVDEGGRVHFGDRPPVDTKAKDISGNLTPINAVGSTEKRQPLNTVRVSRNVDEEYQARQLREAQEKQQEMDKACSKARSNLKILQGRVAFFDNNGNEVRRTERERQQMAAKLQRQINDYCS